MPNDQQFKIKIVTEADTSAVKQHATALEDAGTAGKKAEEKVNEATKETGKSKRELREIIRDLGREFPGIGDLLRVGMMGVTGAIMLGIKAVSSFLEQIQELGNRGTPEFARLTEAIKSSRQAIEDADQAAKNYERSLEAIRTASEAVQTASAAAQKAAQESSGRDTTILEKQHAAQTAAIEAAEKAAVISHEQALIAKFQADEAYAKKRLQLELELQNKLLALKYNEQANLEIEAATLTRKLGPERAAAATTAAAAARAGKTTPRDEAALDATQKKLEELEKEKDELSGFHPFKTEILLRQQRNQNQEEIDAAEQTITDLRKRIAQDTAAEARTRDAADAAKAARDEDEARLRQDTEAIAKSKRELPREAAAAQANRAAAQAGASIESTARQAGLASEFLQTPGMLTGAEAAATAMTHGQRAAADQTQLLQGLLTLLGANNTNSKQLIQLVAKAQTDIDEQKRLISYLQMKTQGGARPSDTNH